MCCASSSKQALIASFSYQVIRHPGREYSASAEPCFNAGYVLLTDLAGPRVLVPLAMSIHLKQVPDQFASHARVRLDFPQQRSALSCI